MTLRGSVNYGMIGLHQPTILLERKSLCQTTTSSMTSAALPLPQSYLQQARACLGICRHCFESTTSTQACHTSLSDVIVSLEVAIMLLGAKNELADDHLCHCVEICARCAAEWGKSRCPSCQQSASACQSFVAFWRSNRH